MQVPCVLLADLLMQIGAILFDRGSEALLLSPRGIFESEFLAGGKVRISKHASDSGFLITSQGGG